jgi:FixJ family two-component response regulator
MTLQGLETMPRNAVSRVEIFVVDDDAEMRERLSAALQEEGYDVICFADGAALLSTAKTRVPACIFLEVRNPGKSGIDILKKLRAEEYPAPIFVISGQGDIPTAVEAIRSGALDFIEKPPCGIEMIARVKAAIGTLSQVHNDSPCAKISSLQIPGREPLTRREREVLARLAVGASNKETARQLGVSSRTVEGHRANIMKKVGVRNAAELIHRVLSEGRIS